MRTAGTGFAEDPHAAAIQLESERQAFVGFAFGCRQPCLRYIVRTPGGTAAGFAALDRLLSGKLGPVFAPAGLPTDNPALSRLLFWTRVMLDKAAHPVLENARWASLPGSAGMVTVVLQPCLVPAAADGAVCFLVSLMNRCMAGKSAGDEDEKIRCALDKLIQDLSASGLRGFNPLHFLTAAGELDIPWTRLGGNLFQFGFGARALDRQFIHRRDAGHFDAAG